MTDPMSAPRRRAALLAIVTLLAQAAAAETPSVPIGYTVEKRAGGPPLVASCAISASLFTGDVFIVDPMGNGVSGDQVMKLSPDATVSALAPVGALFIAGGIDVSPTGDVYVWDSLARDILRISPDGATSVFQSFPGGTGQLALTTILGLAFDGDGDLYAGSPAHDEIYRIAPDGTVSTFVTAAQVPGGLDIPGAMDVAPNGDLLVVDYHDHRLLRIAPDGTATVVLADTGMIGQEAIAVDPLSGDVFMTVGRETIVRVDGAGNVTPFASGFDGVTGLAFGRSSIGGTLSLYASQFGAGIEATDGDAIFEIRKSPTPTEGYGIKTLAEGAPFDAACNLTVSPFTGDLYVADPKGNGISGDQVMKVTPDGVVTTFAPAGALAVSAGMDIDQNGDLYFVDGGAKAIVRVTPAGVASTFLDLVGPGGGMIGDAVVHGIAWGPDGFLYGGSPLNDLIYRIDMAGNLTPFVTAAQIPGGLDIPGQLVFAPNGDLIVNDYTGARVIRVTPAGVATEVASGIGSIGQAGMAVDPATGDIFIAESRHRILRIDGAGDISTFACGFDHVAGLDFGPSTSGSGTSLFVSQFGAWIDVTDGDAIFEIKTCPGGYQSYGQGVAGSGGLAPAFCGSGCPSPGFELGLNVDGGVGGAFGILVAGAQAVVIPLLAGTLLVEPLVIVPHLLDGSTGVPGAGTLHLGFTMPDDATLIGGSFYFQGIYADAGAPLGVSMTQGLRVDIQ